MSNDTVLQHYIYNYIIWVHYHIVPVLRPCCTKEVAMKMVRILVQVPLPLKAHLDALRVQGTTASGLIRNLLSQHFNQPHVGRKGAHR